MASEVSERLEELEFPMATGKISKVLHQEGYGFVANEEQPRIFFHQRWLNEIQFRDLNEGDEVIFRLEDGPRGFRARELNLLSAVSEEDKRKYEAGQIVKSGQSRRRGKKLSGPERRIMNAIAISSRSKARSTFGSPIDFQRPATSAPTKAGAALRQKILSLFKD